MDKQNAKRKVNRAVERAKRQAEEWTDDACDFLLRISRVLASIAPLPSWKCAMNRIWPASPSQNWMFPTPRRPGHRFPVARQ